MIRLFFLALLLLVGFLAVREWPVAGGVDVRGWLLGERMPRVEEGLARLEREQSQSNQAVGDQLTDLAGQVQELKTVVARLESTARMLRMENGSIAAKQDDSAWHLTSIFTRVREFRQRVEFSHAFAQPPQVVLGIVMLDFNQDKIRFQASAEAIDAQGFTVLFTTQVEERPREVRVEWLAYGP